MNRASAGDIESHLRECDAHFNPPLSRRVDIREFAAKIHFKSTRFEAWNQEHLVGLVSAYFNDPGRQTGFINHVGVSPALTGRGMATDLLGRCVEHGRQLGFAFLELEVSPRSRRAIRLYKRVGFKMAERLQDSIRMKMALSPSLCEEKR